MRAVLVIFAVILGLSGCGDDSDSSSRSSTGKVRVVSSKPMRWELCLGTLRIDGYRMVVDSDLIKSARKGNYLITCSKPDGKQVITARN